MHKRIIALTLAAVMIFMSLPVTAYADTLHRTSDVHISTVDEEEVTPEWHGLIIYWQLPRHDVFFAFALTLTDAPTFDGEYCDANPTKGYLRARSFNPRTGRFTQPDPWWGVQNMNDSPLAILQAANLFVFGVNNPVRWLDPLGLFVMDVFDSSWFDMTSSELRNAGITHSTTGNSQTGVTVRTITSGGVTFRSDGSIVGGGSMNWNNIMTDSQRASGHIIGVNSGVIFVGQSGGTFTPVHQIGLNHTPFRDSLIQGAVIGTAIRVVPSAGAAITRFIVGTGTAAAPVANQVGDRVSSLMRMDLQFFGGNQSSFVKKSAAELERMVSGAFHGAGGAKAAILRDLSPDVLRQVGRNPDIHVNRDGLIQVVSTVRRGVSFITDLNINWY